jgi:hypothetical protein
MLCQSVIALSIIGMRLYVAHFVAQQFLGDSNSAPNKVYNVELASQDVDFKRKKIYAKAHSTVKQQTPFTPACSEG